VYRERLTKYTHRDSYYEFKKLVLIIRVYICTYGSRMKTDMPLLQDKYTKLYDPKIVTVLLSHVKWTI
jgi:hypothetical protein